MLNVLELIVCVLIVIILVFYFFYWNRFFAFLFSLLVRFALWNQGEASVWVKLGSIQFSVLGGRILIKDLRYHSSNQTFRIVKGQISWRYWLRRPAEEEDLSHARVIGDATTGKGSSPLACRVHISLQGLEWFIYNRTAAFDNIVSQLDPDIPITPVPTPVPADGAASVRKIFSRSSVFRDPSILGPPISLVSSIYKRTPTFVKRAIGWVQRQLPNLDPKDLLPISLEVVKGAITIGNASTPNLLAAQFQRAEGTYGIVESRSKYDLYKQVLNVKLQNPSVSYVENDNYTSPMAEIGRRTHDHVNHSDTAPLRRSSYLSYLSFERVWKHLRLWRNLPVPSRTHAPASIGMVHPQTWGRRKQQKSVDEETPLGIDFSTLEYAIERKILEATVLEVLYYADVVGVVPPLAVGQESTDESSDPFDIGNGDLPPEWGVDLVVRGGFVRYGPWADRQRVVLQHAFFPPTFCNAQPTPRLKPGDMRMWTGMKIFVELRDGVTLQLPFREPSKNWQWDGKADVKGRPRKREAASIHVRAGDSSTISYIVPMVATAKGYISALEVHLDTVTVTSSLNDIRLLTAETCRIRSSLPAPLKWNGLRQWTFSISLRTPCLYLLRDHINMFTDLGKDWSTGPPSDYNLFTPMIYVVDLDMHNYDINLYVNDHNIIDKPLIREDNALLTLRGNHLTNGIHMPFNKYRPDATAISFWIEAPDVYVNLSLPRWNISSLSTTPDRTQVGRIGMLNMKGSYRYFAEVSPDHVDQLKLDFSASDVVYKAFGWTIRYFMVLRDNYFGSFTHFSTLTEYLDKMNAELPRGDPIDQQYREGQSNAMQVSLGLDVTNGLMVLPAGYPGHEKHHDDEEQNTPEDLGPCLMLSLPSLQLHLRTNDYYMEMSLNVDTISGRISEHCYNDTILSASTRSTGRRDKIVIDGLDVIANRLFGPRPHTSTYVCIWEIHVGDVKTIMSVHEALLLSMIGSSFGINFSDPLNSPAERYALAADPDVTFLKVQIDAVHAVWAAGEAAAELALPNGLRFDSNDLAGKTFRKVTSLRIPEGSVKVLLSRKQDRARWIEAADAQLDIDLDVYSAPPNWRDSADRQTRFIAEQDVLTQRAKILYTHEDNLTDASRIRPGRGALDNDFYLPQIRIPRLSPVEKLPERLAVPLASLREDLSESDADPVPESIRDARLADMRPASIPIDVLSDEDISSGDESDDGDLTDWSTEYEDPIEDTSESPWPAVNRYSSHCRHFESRFLTRPVTWVSSPFVLTKDVHRSSHSSTLGSQDADSSAGPMTAYSMPMPPDEDNEGVSRSIYRVRSKRGISVRVTPLILPAVTPLLQDIDTSQLSPELRIDALTIKYIKAFKGRSSAVDSITCLDIQLPLLRVRSLQLVKVALPHAVSHQGTALVTILELLSAGAHFRGRLTSGSRMPARNAISCGFASLTAALLSQFPGRQSHRQDVSEQCQVAVGPSLFSTMQEQFSMSFGTLSADIGHSGPDFAFATIVALTRYSCGLALARKKPSGPRPSTDRQVVQGILTYSRQRPVVDPLSTIQPSYLVQRDLPDELRKDVTFKFLVYLRYCLRFLDERERQALKSLHPNADHDVSIEDVLNSLHNQWFGVGGDDDTPNVSKRLLLRELMHAPHADALVPKNSMWDPPFKAINTTFSGLHLTLRHPNGSGHSGFVSGPITLNLHHQPVDLVQAVGAAANRSHSALPSKIRERRRVLRLSLSLALDHISCTVHPEAVEFIQVILRAYRHHGVPLRDILQDLHSPRSTNNESPVSRPVSPSRKPTPTLSIDVTLSMRSFTFMAADEKLVLRFKNADVTYASSFLAKFPSKEQPTWDISMNHSLMFGGASFEACVATASAQTKEHILASLSLVDSRTNVVLQQDVNRNITLRVFSGLGKLHLDMPRSALRLYRFVEGWRADYLPGLDAAIRALLGELRGPPNSPHPPPSHSSHSSRLTTFQVQASVTSVRATLQVMHGTWLSWEMHKTIAFLDNDSRHRGSHLFGLQMGPHVFSISRTRSQTRPVSSSSIRLELPTVTLRGRHDSTGLQGLALVEFFHLTVRPSDWDTLLSVQQKSGQDFNDLIHIIEQSRQKPIPREFHAAPDADKNSRPSLPFHGSFKMKGFRIGLEGLASTVFLECDDISGGVSNHSRSLWHVKLSDLALSLASRLAVPGSSNRDRRSAFFRIDFDAHMEKKPDATVPHLEVSIAKVHAVMQPSSIGELGDFIDHLQAEVSIRQDQRATELAEFKEKTKSLMRTLDVKMGEPAASEKSLLELYTISLGINNIGVAFPLTLAKDLQMPRSGSHDDSSVRAFLFSIKSLKFSSQLGENGQASMINFAFQFVTRFRQGVSADFSGENHKTRNRLLYPEMTAEARSERVAGSRRVCIGAQVSGFVLDVDSAIPDFVSSLLDVYRRGKDRVERLGGAARSSPSTESAPRVEQKHSEERYGALPTSNILVSLTFASGKVRMHSRDSVSHHRRGVLSTLVYGRSDDANGAEEFNLPEVSVWGEFRATPAVHKLANANQPNEPSTLVFKSTIHSSQNTLRPSVLPFLTELMANIEEHMRSTSWKGPQASPAPKPYGLFPPVTAAEEAPPARSTQVDPVSSMKISFSLRIDQSKLHFTCRPDANVIAGLYWDSGGFIINIAPGARRVSFTGTVGGLTVALKHGFLSEDCVKLNARNLNFSMAFAKVQPDLGRVSSSISVVVDTEFSGGIRFSRLQDVLCFKAVWLDRIPAFSGGNLTPSERPSGPPSALLTPLPPSSSPAKQELTTALLVRLRRVELDVDLGQSISNIKLTLADALFRTKITEVLSELSLSIEQLAIVASGNLSGHVDLPDFQFQSVRRNNTHFARESGGRMLDLSMTSGIFSVKLDSEYHELIQYRAEPISIYIYDDWSRISSDIPAEDRRVDLDFLVSGSDVLAIMTVGTVPKLVSYVNKFRTNLDAQRDGARRESQAFRIANEPKPDNPLSAVANAMFKSARSRLKESESGISYTIGQRMSLQLERLQLIVFPRSMRDQELAQFVGLHVHARLQRIIQGDEEPAKRDLRLHFSAISISKVSQLHHALVPKDRSLPTPEWLKTVVAGSPEATIFGLPSMSMHMRSTETQDGSQRVLAYDFKSSFEKAGVKDAEDIYISLNMALYSWLTVLRKTFAREMEQVQASADARAAVGAAASTGSGAQTALALRKKTHEAAGAVSLPVDDGAGGSEMYSSIRTRPRGRGSISTRTVPLAAHSAEDITLTIPLVPLKISTTAVGSGKIASPVSATSSADPPSATSSGSAPLNAPTSAAPSKKTKGLVYEPHDRKIERLTMRQLGEATPDVMHPFFMKKAGFNLEDSLPQYVHEYATMPTEEIMKVLLKLYSKQLTTGDEPPLPGREMP